MRLHRIESFAIKTLGYLKNCPKSFFELLKNKKYYSPDSTYFPELANQKSKARMFVEQLCSVLLYGHINDYYFLYGLDHKYGKEYKSYVNYWKFRNIREEKNLSERVNPTILLRNKFYFGLLAESINIPTAKNIAYYDGTNNLYIIAEKKNIAFESFLNSLPDCTLFCKEAYGECGLGIFSLHVKRGKIQIDNEEIRPSDLKDKMKGTPYLFQEKIIQHSEMSRLYPESVNTMRIVTVRDDLSRSFICFPSMLRIGANGSHLDNTSRGGIAVGFDLETGKLHKYGYFKPQFGKKIEIHPDTGVRLADFTIPYCKEAVELALRFHSFLPGVFSIGWDVSIGQNGPVFIEGNDNWEINGPQVGNYGFNELINRYFYNKR